MLLPLQFSWIINLICLRCFQLFLFLYTNIWQCSNLLYSSNVTVRNAKIFRPGGRVRSRKIKNICFQITISLYFHARTRLTCERAYFLQIKPRTKIAFWPDARAAFWTFPGLSFPLFRWSGVALGIRKVGTFGNYCHTRELWVWPKYRKKQKKGNAIKALWVKQSVMDTMDV